MHYDDERKNINTENKSYTPNNIKDLWQTPKEVFNKLNNEFSFTCDVAASKENYLAFPYLTIEDDALNNEWGFVNWCNPPYSNIKPWVCKAIEQQKLGKTIVMLVPSDTSVKWFKLAYESCNEVRFISGRLSFINADTQKPVNGNNKGSVIFIWRSNSPINTHTTSLIGRDYFYSNVK